MQACKPEKIICDIWMLLTMDFLVGGQLEGLRELALISVQICNVTLCVSHKWVVAAKHLVPTVPYGQVTPTLRILRA